MRHGTSAAPQVQEQTQPQQGLKWRFQNQWLLGAKVGIYGWWPTNLEVQTIMCNYSLDIGYSRHIAPLTSSWPFQKITPRMAKDWCLLCTRNLDQKQNPLVFPWEKQLPNSCTINPSTHPPLPPSYIQPPTGSASAEKRQVLRAGRAP